MGDESVVRKCPKPLPDGAMELAVVGLPVVFQQIPLSVTGLPPSPVTVPPPLADTLEIPFTVSVLTDGIDKGRVENDSTLP